MKDERNFSPIGGYEQTCSHLKRDQLTSSKIACSISKSFWVSEILPVPKSRASISTGAMSFATTTRKGKTQQTATRIIVLVTRLLSGVYLLESLSVHLTHATIIGNLKNKIDR